MDEQYVFIYNGILVITRSEVQIHAIMWMKLENTMAE